MKTIFFLDDCNSTCLIFQKMLSEIPKTNVMTFLNKDEMFKALEYKQPTLVIVDEHLGESIRGAGVSIEIESRFPNVDTLVISSNTETIKELLHNGIDAFLKPSGDLDCQREIQSSKCWSNFLLRVEMKIKSFESKLESKRINSKIDEMSEKLDKIFHHVEKLEKADVLERVDKFIDDVKKKPLLMFFVSVVITLLMMLGIKKL